IISFSRSKTKEAHRLRLFHYNITPALLQLKLVEKPRNSLIQQQSDEADRRALDEVEEDDVPPPLRERLRRAEREEVFVQGEVDVAVDDQARGDLQYAADRQSDRDRRQALFEAVDDGRDQHET